MRVLAIAFFLFMQPVGVDQIQNWYQSGRYQEIVDQGQQASPMGMYLLASSFEKLDRFAEARAVYQQLVGRGESDPWASIGRSAAALVADGAAPAPEALEQAFSAAQQAVMLVGADPASGRPGAVSAWSRSVVPARLRRCRCGVRSCPGAGPSVRVRSLLRWAGALALGAARSDGDQFRALPQARARSRASAIADAERERALTDRAGCTPRGAGVGRSPV